MFRFSSSHLPRLCLIGTVLLTVLYLLGAALSVSAQGESAPAVILTDSQGEYSLSQYIEILRDPGRSLTIQDVSSSAFSNRFVRNQQNIPGLGITTDAVWLRFRVDNRASPLISWRLVLTELRHGKVDLYVPNDDGSWSVKQTGRDLPFSTRDVPHRFFVFHLPTPPGAEQTIYMRLASVSPMLIPLSIWSTGALAQSDQSEILFYGLFYGAMLIMAGYNLFLFWALRDKSYLFLSLFILAYASTRRPATGWRTNILFPISQMLTLANLLRLHLLFFSSFFQSIFSKRACVSHVCTDSS